MLIRGSLNEVISYLESLDRKLRPAFEKKGIRIFDVGVDISETAKNGSIVYSTNLYRNSKDNAVKIMTDEEPAYQGLVQEIAVAKPYSQNSILNLFLLKDICDENIPDGKSLESIIRYLEELERKIRPEFEGRGYNIFDVGIDMIETHVEKSVVPIVIVYVCGLAPVNASFLPGSSAYEIANEIGLPVEDIKELVGISSFDLAEIVKKAEPSYKGKVGSIKSALPYSWHSTLNLAFLKDLKNSRMH